MNTNTLYATCLFAALNICTFSASAEADVTPQTYTYGTHLDIQKVVALTQDAGASCGIVDAQLTYLNSQGKTEILNYRKFAECHSDN